MKIRFSKIASLEFHDAVEYYNEQKLGLGYELVFEIDKGLVNIRRVNDEKRGGDIDLIIDTPENHHEKIAHEAMTKGILL
jgi:hypothetical protein